MPAIEPAMDETLDEAARLMNVCNSCRYCEGLCAVFPAMEQRRVFGEADLTYLAHLCHNCGACYSDCQFAPPHEFAVNVPATLAKLRNESYRRLAWPAALQPLFDRHGIAVAAIAALSMAGFLLAAIMFVEPTALWTESSQAGAFYRLIPHQAMALLFGTAFAYALAAMAIAALNYWRALGQLDLSAGDYVQAARDTLRLTYLDGGGAGCNIEANRIDPRKLFHHCVFYGFTLCFAATTIATLYHYLLGREAPYAWYDAPVLLGTVGGIGILVGGCGLSLQKRQRGKTLRDSARGGMEAAFVLLLMLTSASGLALLAARATAFMNILLSLHLGVVLAFFLTLPYSKMVHGLYRALSLLRYAAERRINH